ncbi:MAG: PEP-CTERM sorting domain-containing protein [Planctomycetes bacterium]|nr:PEP-CTERM sorting domain-containing protein [Planctomycetota bacterium]
MRGRVVDSVELLHEFLARVKGTDEIEYWDGTDWSKITNAMAGEDYFIVYHDDGDLAGFTVLTVTAVPEPATLMLLLTCGVLAIMRNRRK